MSASTLAAAETAWLRYRDEYQRQNPWADSRRLARQTRKREFVAGYLAALADSLQVSS